VYDFDITTVYLMILDMVPFDIKTISKSTKKYEYYNLHLQLIMSMYYLRAHMVADVKMVLPAMDTTVWISTSV